MPNLLTFEEYVVNEKLDKDFLKKVIFMRFGSTIKGLTGHDDVKSSKLNSSVIDNIFIAYHTDKDIEKDLEVDVSLPIIYYGGTAESSLNFLKKHKIKKSNLYNKPEFIPLSGNKKKFHETLKDASFIPKTMFNKEDAINFLTFPIIAKPGNGHSGIGIKKFDTVKELKEFKESFDVYSEFINFKKEFRLLFFKEECIHIDERITNLKTKRDIKHKKQNEQLDFIYVKQDLSKIPFIRSIKEIAKKIREKIPLDIFSLDIILDENDKIYVLETNSATGLGAHKLVAYYIEVYEDFFGESLPKWFISMLNEKYVIPSLLLSYPKFKKEVESSEWAIDYSELLK